MKNQFQQLSSKVSFCLGVVTFSTALALTPNLASADMMEMPPAQPATDSMKMDHDMMKKDHEAMRTQSHKGHKQMQQSKDTSKPMKDAPMMDDDAMAPDNTQDPGMSGDM